MSAVDVTERTSPESVQPEEEARPDRAEAAGDTEADTEAPSSSSSAPDGARACDSGSEEAEDGDKPTSEAFECNICLDVARDAVISVCGHLFCWPCLHQWLETRPNRQICPVCKAGISRDKVIPLYGRGNTDRKDPRDKV